MSTHTTIESITAESIDNIELRDDKTILVKGSGYIEIELQSGSNSDLRRGDGDVSNMSFPLEFSLILIAENTTEKPEDEKYSLEDIDFRIDTSKLLR